MAALYVALSVTGAMAAVYSGKIRFHFDARRVTMKNQAYYHLPGLFEFYELYRVFLSLYREHREYFYDWCEIGSIYGAPSDCIWGGGRTSFGDTETEKVLDWEAEKRELPEYLLRLLNYRAEMECRIERVDK